jgi:hypothetical protein
VYLSLFFFLFLSLYILSRFSLFLPFSLSLLCFVSASPPFSSCCPCHSLINSALGVRTLVGRRHA